MTTKEQEAIYAHHEAGHAVLAVILGVPILHTTIIKRGRYILGNTPLKPYNDLSPEEQEKYKANFVIIALAGRYAAKELDPELKKGTSEDDKKIHIFVAGFFPNLDPYKYFEDYKLKAEKEIEKNKKYIEAVARVLLIKKTLNQTEVIVIIENCR